MAQLIACDYKECTKTTNPDKIMDRWVKLEYLSYIHRHDDIDAYHFCSEAHVIAYFEDRLRTHMA